MRTSPVLTDPAMCDVITTLGIVWSRRLRIRDIKARPYAASGQLLDQCLLIDQRAARRIDEGGPVFHKLEIARVDHMTRSGDRWSMQ